MNVEIDSDPRLRRFAQAVTRAAQAEGFDAYTTIAQCASIIIAVIVSADVSDVDKRKMIEEFKDGVSKTFEIYQAVHDVNAPKQEGTS